MKDMKMYILNNGWLEGDQNHMTAMAVMATVHDKHPAAKWGKFPVFAMLIEHPTEGYILFDCGCHPDTMNGYHPPKHLEVIPYYFEEEQRLDKQLELIGVKPAEIKTIILSHMHYDHIGNLYMFPGSDVYVPRKDYEHGKWVIENVEDSEQRIAYVKEDFEVPVNWHMLKDEDYTFCEGIKVVHVPGHCPDHVALVVDLENSGTLILPQDSISSRFVYGPPAGQTTFVYDTLSYYTSIEKLRKIAEEKNADIIFSHDDEFFQTLKKAPEYYD